MKQPSPLYVGLGVAITVVSCTVDEGDGAIDVALIPVNTAVTAAVADAVTDAVALTLAVTDAVAFALAVGDTVAAMVDET